MNELFGLREYLLNFWAIRFIQPPVSGLIIRPPALSPQLSYYVDALAFLQN